MYKGVKNRIENSRENSISSSQENPLQPNRTSIQVQEKLKIQLIPFFFLQRIRELCKAFMSAQCIPHPLDGYLIVSSRE